MKGKIKAIKKQIDAQKKKSGGRLVIPLPIWQKIYECSKNISIIDICHELGIDPNNARRRMRQLGRNDTNIMTKKKTTRAAELPPKVVQLSNDLDNGRSPLMEISLPSGASIKVYSA